MKPLVVCAAVTAISILSVHGYGATIPSEGGHYQTLKEIVRTEYGNFQTVAAIDNIKMGQLVFSETQPTHMMDDNYNVVIKLSEIEAYTKDGNEDFERLFVKFVIAHEIGHIIQFAGFRKEVISKRQGEGTVFLECEADILAGLLITQELNSVEMPQQKRQNINFDEGAYNKRMKTTMSSVYKKIFDMDRENTDIKTHPGNEDRLMSVRQGVTVGNITLYYFLIYHPDPSAATLNPTALESVKELYKILTKASGFNPNSTDQNNPFQWAHEEAIRITNENNSLARNLILFDKNITWDKSADNPLVDFSFQILNQNKKSVNFAGRICTEIIPRTDPHNIINIGPVDSYNFNKIIAPGEIISISGRLKWIASTDYMPHIVLPGDTRSLYWVFDAVNPQVDASQVKTILGDFGDGDHLTSDDIIDFMSPVVGSRGDLFSYARGIGKSNATESSKVASGRISYEPTFEEGHGNEQHIYVDRKHSSVEFDFRVFSSGDNRDANNLYDEIALKLSNAFRQYKAVPSSANDTNYKSIGYYLEGKQGFRLMMIQDDMDKTYRISINIYGGGLPEY